MIWISILGLFGLLIIHTMAWLHLFGRHGWHVKHCCKEDVELMRRCDALAARVSVLETQLSVLTHTFEHDRISNYFEKGRAK